MIKYLCGLDNLRLRQIINPNKTLMNADLPACPEG